MPNPLQANEIEAALKHLPGWTHREGKLSKTFKFSDFRQAVSFIIRIAFEAEAANHHPELFNVYSTVEIALSTHDAGGRVTHKDVDLAAAIEKISGA